MNTGLSHFLSFPLKQFNCFPDFNYLAESYVSSLNNGSTPSIPSIIKHIVEAEFIREKENITNHYTIKMNERLVKPMSVEELEELCAELRAEAMKRFKKHKVLQKASNTNEMELKLTVSERNKPGGNCISLFVVSLIP